MNMKTLDKYFLRRQANMKRNLKKIFSIFLAVTLLLSSIISFNTESVNAATPKLNKTKITLAVGKSTNLKVSDTNNKVKWSTSDRTIVTVSEKGKVTGKNVGTAIITAKVGKKNLQCKVTVKVALNRTKAVIAKNDYVKLALKGATVKKFTTSNKKIATVSKNGKVVGKRKGRATITAIDNNGKKYTCKVTVEDPSLNKKKVTLQENQNYRLKLNGNTQKITWSSSDENIASVNSKGLVTAHSEGMAVITASVGNKNFKCRIIVEKEEIPETTPTPEPSVEPTATPTPEPTPTPTSIPWYPSEPEPVRPTATPTPTETPAPIPTETPTPIPDKEWTVSFDSNGGTVLESVSVKDGERLNRPSDPEKEKNIFVGWYTDEELTQAYDFDRRVRKDILLYAKWSENIDNAESYTRGEWMELLAAMLDMNLNTDIDSIEYYYADTQESEYAVAIETSQAYGLIPSVELEDENQDVPYFYPEEAATREFVAYTVAKALGYNELAVESADWSDWGDITYKNETEKVVALDLMRLKDNAFQPKEPLNENDEKLIENGIYQLRQSTKNTEIETEDNSVYAEDVVKDQLTDVKDYSVVENADETYTVTIATGINTIGVDVGETLVLPANDGYPTGIALKVIAVNDEDGLRTFTCEKPELSDVYSVIDFSGGATALPDQIEVSDGFNVAYDPEGTVETETNEIATYKNISGTGHVALPGKLTFTTDKTKISDALEFSGKIEVEIPDVMCSIDADVGLRDGISVHEFTLALTEKVKMSQNLTYKIAESGYELTNGNGNTRFEAGRIEIGRLPFAIGATGLSLDLVIFANVSAKGTVSISYSFSAQQGFQYKDGSKRLIKNFSDSLEDLELKASGSATLGFAADVCALHMFDLAGITVDFGPAFEASYTEHEDFLYCSEVSLYATSKLQLDQETVVGKFLKNVLHYTLEYSLLKNNSDNPLRMHFHVENGHRVNECTLGTGKVEGYVMSAQNNEAISGARVQIYNESAQLITTKYTGTNGKYKIDTLTPGTYKISISANGYQRYDINITAHKNTTTYAENAKMVSRTSQIGTVNGEIVNAVTGQGITDTSYKVYKGWNITDGDVVASGNFESSDYELELVSGNYTLEVAKDGFITNYVNIAIQENLCMLQNITLSPENSGSLDGNEKENIRIVLTWGETPEDLDSHLFGPVQGDSDSLFHTAFYQKNYYYDGKLIANLDLDDTTSYGPETTTIYSVAEQGIYSYFVHDYTNKSKNFSTELSASGAKVQVYVGNTLYYTFNVPTGCEGTNWHVFDYNAQTDTITPVNTFAYTDSSDDVMTASLDEEYTMDYESRLLHELWNLPEKEETGEEKNEFGSLDAKSDIIESESQSAEQELTDKEDTDIPEFTAGESSEEFNSEE